MHWVAYMANLKKVPVSLQVFNEFLDFLDFCNYIKSQEPQNLTDNLLC